MKSKLKVIVALIVIVGCLGWAAFNISRKRSSSWNESRYLAAMSQLNDAVREGLQDYYHTNGRYPDKLSEVAVDLPKGVEGEMLDKFSYTSRGQLYVVSCGVQWGDGPVQEHTEHAEWLRGAGYAGGERIPVRRAAHYEGIQERAENFRRDTRQLVGRALTPIGDWACK
jgi:hypothetical protein